VPGDVARQSGVDGDDLHFFSVFSGRGRLASAIETATPVA
jgi:hypothetical protein